MVVPLAARWVAAVCGVLLLLTGWSSVIGTLIVPRQIGSWLTRLVDRVVIAAYRIVTRRVTEYKTRDQILATQAAAILLTQLVAWLAIIFVGFALLLWPFATSGISAASAPLLGPSPPGGIPPAIPDAGSPIFPLGFAEPPGAAPPAIVSLAAAS